jgi:hypothetical protein
MTYTLSLMLIFLMAHNGCRDKLTHQMKNEFKLYRKRNFSEMRPYIVGEVLSDFVSISKEDRENGSPKDGDMIARNPENHLDQWLVSKEFFEDNYTLA